MTKLQAMFSIIELCEGLNIEKKSIDEELDRLNNLANIEDIVREAFVEYKKIVS